MKENFSLRENKKYLIFEISSNGVSAAIFEIKNKNPYVIKNFQKELFLKYKPNKEKLKEETEEKLNEISSEIISYIGKLEKNSKDFFSLDDLENIYLFFSAPFVFYKNEIIKTEKSSSFSLTNKFFKNFLNFAKLGLQSQEFKNLNRGEIFLNEKIHNLNINGYPVSISKIPPAKIKEIKTFIFNSKTEKETKKYFERILEKNFMQKKIFSLASTPAFLENINLIFKPEGEFVFINFYGEDIEIGYFSENKVVFVGNISHGKNTLARELVSSGFSKNLEEAKSLYNMYVSGTINNSSQEKIKHIFKAFEKQIKSKIEDFFESENIDFKKVSVFVNSENDKENFILRDLNLFDENRIKFFKKNDLKDFSDNQEILNKNIFLKIKYLINFF